MTTASPGDGNPGGGRAANTSPAPATGHPSPTRRGPRPTPVIIAASRRQLTALIAVVGTAVVAICALLFGPARGARNDLGHVRTDLHSAKHGIYETLAANRGVLATTTSQLRVVEKSLALQQKGLSVASQSEELAQVATGHTHDLLVQTTSTLNTVRQILTALGPVKTLQADVHVLVRATTAALSLARSTLAVARQTLSTGQEALRVAIQTLKTLQSSRDIQQQLLEVAKQTLKQTQEINRKIPLPPVFPASPTTASK